MTSTMLFPIVVVWMYCLHVSSTVSGNQLGTDRGKKTPYMTSDAGRKFLLAIPTLNEREATVIPAELCFMTYAYEARVTMHLPKDVHGPYTEYIAENYVVKRSKPVTRDLDKSHIIQKVWPGNAIKITASADIVVQVTIYGNEKMADTFILPPTTAYATRYTLNGHMQSFVLILASHENTVVSYDSVGHVTVACAWNVTCGISPMNNFVLNATTFAYLSWDRGSFEMGSRITASRPILVILGSQELPIIMAMPSDSSSGQTFVVVSTLSAEELPNYTVQPKYPRSLYILSRNKDPTKLIVDLHYPGGDEEKYMDDKGWITQHIIRQEPFFIVTTNQPVSMTYKTYPKNPVVINRYSVVLPNKAWPSYAVFRKPSRAEPDRKYRIYLVAHTSMKEGLLYDGLPASKSGWTKVAQFYAFPYEYTIQEMIPEYIVIMQMDPRNTFLAYVATMMTKDEYALDFHLGMSYHFPERFSEDDYEDDCLFKMTSVRELDGMDNDCDGRIDEELLNGLDDDDDGLIDEDSTRSRSAGAWGDWMTWQCDSQCSQKGGDGKGGGKGVQLRRSRACDMPAPTNKGAPCIGDDIETGKSCKANCSVIPQSCSLGKYGSNCLQECPKGCALGYCDRATGRCSGCQVGFIESDFCDIQYYQALERSDESTPFSAWMVLVPLAMTVLVLAVIACDVLRRRRAQEQDDSDTEANEFEDASQAATTPIDEDEIFSFNFVDDEDRLRAQSTAIM